MSFGKRMRTGLVLVSVASVLGLMVGSTTAYAKVEPSGSDLAVAAASYQAEASSNTRSGQVTTGSCSGCSGGQKIRYISVNGGSAQQVSFTGSSWSEPVTRNVTVSLNAGSNTIRFFNDSASAPDLDQITVRDGDSGAGPVEPGGWISYSPTFTVQERGCGDVNNLTFTLSCDDDGDMRAERRYATYSSGTRQFQGYFRITSMGGTRISLKQTFRPNIGAYFMLAVERGGRLYSVSGGATIATGATVGTTVRVNTVHVVGSQHRTYINGSLRHTTSSPSGEFHDKFGAYATGSGQGPITVVWSNVQFWRK